MPTDNEINNIIALLEKNELLSNEEVESILPRALESVLQFSIDIQRPIRFSIIAITQIVDQNSDEILERLIPHLQADEFKELFMAINKHKKHACLNYLEKKFKELDKQHLTNDEYKFQQNLNSKIHVLSEDRESLVYLLNHTSPTYLSPLAPQLFRDHIRSAQALLLFTEGDIELTSKMVVLLSDVFLTKFSPDEWETVYPCCTRFSLKRLVEDRIKNSSIQNFSQLDTVMQFLDSEEKQEVIKAVTMHVVEKTSLQQPIPIFLKQLCRLKEVQVILGLDNILPEGLMFSEGNRLIERRFHDLQPSPAHIPFMMEDVDALSELKLDHTGDIKHISAGWEGHAWSCHLIKENDQIHLIYVNRGERASLDDPAVMVRTIDNPKMLGEIIQKLLGALKSEDQTIISSCFSDIFLENKRNKVLEETLHKSNQKVGNCSVANKNIAWHLAIAADIMRQASKKGEILSFKQAYEQAKPIYKKMRMVDRALAFKDLISMPLDEVKKQTALNTILKKMALKDIEDPSRHSIFTILSELDKDDLTHSHLKQVLADIITLPSDNRYAMPIAKLKWIHAVLNILPEADAIIEKNKWSKEIAALDKQQGEVQESILWIAGNYPDALPTFLEQDPHIISILDYEAFKKITSTLGENKEAATRCLRYAAPDVLKIHESVQATRKFKGAIATPQDTAPTASMGSMEIHGRFGKR